MALKVDKDAISTYIYNTPFLKSIFFNPFVLIIVLTTLIIIIQYMLPIYPDDDDYGLKEMLVQWGYYGVLLMLFIVMHDVLIKNRYRSEIFELKEKLSKYQTIGAQEYINNSPDITPNTIESLYQDNNVPVNAVQPSTGVPSNVAPLVADAPVVDNIYYN